MIERVSLFNKKRDFFIFIFACLLILSVSLFIEYRNFLEFNRFDSALVEASVLKQYTKSKNNRTYQVLKLKSSDGLTFYTTAKKSLQDVKTKRLKLEIWPKDLNFQGYLTTFYANSKIKDINESLTLKNGLNAYISASHEDKNVANIYQALYTAAPLDSDLQKTFSNLGVSHLLAISGFHLGVLSALLYLFLRPVYSFAQNRYFPYRNSKLDIFLAVAFTLFFYMLFLDSPPSLIRAFGMLVIGFVLYDRGIKIVSMQTLFLSVLLILSFFPRLFFSLGFWLSASGVFYIFLFLIHFKHLNKLWRFTLLPIWVYVMMLPFSLAIFENFSVYHPLSIIWTTLFTLFYPLSIFLHLINFGNLFDAPLLWLIEMGREGVLIKLNPYLFYFYLTLSIGAVFMRFFMWSLLLFGSSVFIHAIYNVA